MMDFLDFIAAVGDLWRLALTGRAATRRLPRDFRTE
jgi:hypothetical protein